MWQGFARQLDAAAAEGQVVEFWWRDDDATTACASMHRLLDLAAGANASIALAVIPFDADDALAVALDDTGHRVWQHGFAHVDHAGGTAPSEFGDDRTEADMAEDIAAGRDRLDRLFRDRVDPVFVPPWGRMGEGAASAARSLGMRAVSEHGLVVTATSPDRRAMVTANTLIDILDWDPPRAGDPDRIDHELADHVGYARHLRDRRRHPIGILSHHQLFDDTAWAHLGDIVECITEHPAATWVSPRSLLTEASA